MDAFRAPISDHADTPASIFLAEFGHRVTVTRSGEAARTMPIIAM